MGDFQVLVQAGLAGSLYEGLQCVLTQCGGWARVQVMVPVYSPPARVRPERAIQASAVQWTGLTGRPTVAGMMVLLGTRSHHRYD